MMTVGRNTVSGQLLTGFVERIETIRERKKQLGADERAVVAEATSAGFRANAIRHVIKLREMKPHDREEAEAVVEGYLHALGMIHDTPLFRQVGLINVDIASREAVIEALKAFVPQKGSIVVEAGGRPIRLTRADDGTVSASEVVERPAPSDAPPPAAPGGGARAAAGRGRRDGRGDGRAGVQGQRRHRQEPVPVRRRTAPALGRRLATRQRHGRHG
ncbi:MAG: DUF2312 domain-containing protein [Caulobacteraceae bacterium]|nr:DUF2312 domain-containing protein [Caulobacteraceae bacterium]